MIIQVSQSRRKGFWFPRSIISYAVRAYPRFALGLRVVEDLLADRGVIVSYEGIRVWCQRFGMQIAARIRRDRPAPSDKWYLDEVVISIGGQNTGLARGRRKWPLSWFVNQPLPGNGGAENLGTKSQECSCRQALPNQVDPAMGPGTRPGDRQAAQLRRGSPGSLLNRRSPLAQGIEKPFRGIAARHTTKREGHGSGQTTTFLSVHDQTATLFRPKTSSPSRSILRPRPG